MIKAWQAKKDAERNRPKKKEEVDRGLLDANLLNIDSAIKRASRKGETEVKLMLPPALSSDAAMLQALRAELTENGYEVTYSGDNKMIGIGWEQ